MTDYLTRYELNCGCVSQKVVNNISVCLWKEHGVYHVRAHDFTLHTRLEWNSFHLLGEARKDFRRMSRKYQ